MWLVITTIQEAEALRGSGLVSQSLSMFQQMRQHPHFLTHHCISERGRVHVRRPFLAQSASIDYQGTQGLTTALVLVEAAPIVPIRFWEVVGLGAGAGDDVVGRCPLDMNMLQVVLVARKVGLDTLQRGWQRSLARTFESWS